MLVARSSHESSSDPYTKMARYYDQVYSKIVDYDLEADRLERIIARHETVKKPETFLDIACGTGNYTFVFAERGWKTTGIDISEAMLHVAKEKAGSKTNPSFFKMDMREIDLQGKFDVAAVLFGGFGYLMGPDQVHSFLSSVRERLTPNGLLMFEFWQASAVYPGATRPGGHRSWDRAEDMKTPIIRLSTSKYDAEKNILTVTFDHYVLDTESNRLVDAFRKLTQQ